MTSHCDSPPRIMISAAEASADLYGAQLIQAFTNRHPSAEFVGLAGAKMCAAGCRPIGDLASHSAMLLRVLGNSLRGARSVAAVDQEFCTARYDALVVIDSPVLNLPLADRARRHGVPVLYYVAPQLWAWGRWRLPRIQACVDRLAVILPFEEAFFRKLGLPATFVGHPLFDELAARPAAADRVAEIRGLGSPCVAILPGSRRHVIGEVLPGQLSVAGEIVRRHPRAHIGISVAREGLLAEVQAIVRRSGVQATFYRAENAELLSAADLTLVASGTATLEVAHYGSPMIVMYNGSRAFYHLFARWMLHVDRFSLINLLAGERIVPEFMPYFSDLRAIQAAAQAILADADRSANMRRRIAETIRPLEQTGASDRVADMLAELIES